MFTNKKLIRGLLTKIRRAEKETLDALRARRCEQEPQITDRLLGVMEHLLNNVIIGGVRWTAKTLTDRGRGSQESLFGADFLAVFSVSIDGFNVTKGFMAQAKLVEPTDGFPASEFQRLRDQCEKMLEHSSASYAFLYSEQSGISVVPALTVVGARPCNPHELGSRGISRFYEEHFECFIGDRAIGSADVEGLRSLRVSRNARSAFLLAGKGSSLRSRDD